MNFKFLFLSLIAASMVACAGKMKNAAKDESSKSDNREQNSQVLILDQDQEPMENDSEIEITEFTEDDTSFEELEEEFSLVNKEQIQADVVELNQQIKNTESELDKARSILDELVKKNQPAPQIEAQKKKVVILEDQVFDLNDEKLLKQIESEIE